MKATAIILAAAEGGGGGNPLVQPVPGLMIFTLIVFFVSMLLLWKLAFPPISNMLEKRQKLIEDSMDSAERTRQEADALLTEYRERLKEARVQADEIMAKARKAGDEHERLSKEEAKQAREEMMQQTRRDIEAETQKAIQDIRREVADMTVAATERVTKKSLNDDDQRRLVEEALNDLDFGVFGERR